MDRKGAWITGKRPDKGADVNIYELDKVDRLPGCGDTRAKQLASFAIRNVGDIKGLSDDDIVMLHRELKGISVEKWHNWRNIARTSLPGSYIDVRIDHTRSENPYVSRAAADPTFAPEGWEKVCVKDLRSSRNVVCITELVEHIIQASQKV